jgi:hypothetical protein
MNNYDAATAMHTINEKNDYGSNYENDNFLNRSGNLGETMSMSVKDPSRPPMIIDGLTEFLYDEHKNRLGIITNEPKDLLGFWRKYVSVEQRELRKQKMQNRDGFNSLMDNFDQAGGSSIAVSPKKHKSMVYMGPNLNQFRPQSATVKPPVKLPSNGVMKKYEQFGNLFEMDVAFSIQKVIQEKLDTQMKNDLKRETAQRQKHENAKKEMHTKKMQDMFDAYFLDQRDQMIRKKIAEMKEE